MDIVNRLRGDYGLPIIVETTPICHEAADEIDRLRLRIEYLELVARQAAYRIKNTKKSQRFFAMIDRAVGRK